MTCARQSRRRLIRSVCSAFATCCSCWRIHAINEIRTFVAIRLDETVRATLGAAIEGLRRVARDVAWVAPENLHLTLKFLGQVREARTAELVAAIAQATSGFAAFEATVAGLGAFPTPTRPRVIWAGVGRGADALVGLAGRVDEALAALGFEREPRPFSAACAHRGAIPRWPTRCWPGRDASSGGSPSSVWRSCGAISRPAARATQSSPP